MTLEDCEKRLSKLQDQLTDIRAEISSLKKDMASFCPVDIGDIVEVNGYSHEGKKMIVDSVRYEGEWLGCRRKFRCVGRVLKKDGTPGANKGEHFVQ